MRTTTLGRTGLKVSQLGFGAMRLPMKGEGEKEVVDRDLAIPMIHRAFEGGVNYIDTAVFYCRQDSQRVVGEAVEAWGKRDDLVISTKNHCYDNDEKKWWKLLEDSLEFLRVDCIDVYNHHGLNWKNYQEKVEPYLAKWMQKAQDQGLIKHVCWSFHDNNENLKNIVNTGYGDVITLQYNMLDRQLEEGIALAHEKGYGVVVMGPVGGGRLGVESDVLTQVVDEVKRVPELAMRFVLANPNVDVALSGMSTMQQVEENLATCSDERALTAEELDVIHRQLDRLKEMSDLYCTACGYCKPCPEEIDIPRVFTLFNRGKVYGLWQNAREGYKRMPNPKTGKPPLADACTECGTCEPKCPQNIPIRKQLKEAHEALSAE